MSRHASLPFSAPLIIEEFAGEISSMCTANGVAYHAFLPPLISINISVLYFFLFAIHEAGQKGYELWHHSVGGFRTYTMSFYRQ